MVGAENGKVLPGNATCIRKQQGHETHLQWSGTEASTAKFWPKWPGVVHLHFGRCEVLLLHGVNGLLLYFDGVGMRVNVVNGHRTRDKIPDSKCASFFWKAKVSRFANCGKRAPVAMLDQTEPASAAGRWRSGEKNVSIIYGLFIKVSLHVHKFNENHPGIHPGSQVWRAEGARIWDCMSRYTFSMAQEFRE